MRIKPTETLTKKGIDKNHFGTDDIRIHKTGHFLSWKRPGSEGSVGSAVIEISCRKPEDGEYWIQINSAEYAPNSSKETMIALNEQSAKAIYEYLHGIFGK